MLGFTLPLFIVVGLESVLGLLLLCPKPLNQPAIRLARASYTQARVRWGGGACPCGGCSCMAQRWLQAGCSRGPLCSRGVAPRRMVPPAARLLRTHPTPPATPPVSLQVGATVFHTLAGVLALLLVSPLYDGVRLYRGTQQASNPEQASLDMG